MRMKDSSQVAIAYETLRDRIISYALLPETPISDNKLAKELEMSRAPIREAVLLLQMDGLIQTNEEGKMVVSPITLEDVIDILHVRGALEAEAIRLIAARGWFSEAEEQELRSLYEQMASCAQPATAWEHYSLDDLFHSRLAEYSGSARIRDMLGRMRLQMQRARWLNTADPARQLTATDEHQALLRALLAHDLEGSVSALRIHFQNSEDAFRAILQNRQMQTLAHMIGNFFRTPGESGAQTPLR